MGRTSEGTTRKHDLQWFERNRTKLAAQYRGRWIVIVNSRVRGSFDSEEAAIENSVTEFGIDIASVFHATPVDPYEYVGDLRS
jgi:hypothetical protein